MQTDHPFSYKVPNKFQEIIKKGIRIVVNFGKSDRLVQGFVVNTFDEYNGSYELKEIVDVLDIDPVLNKELLSLSSWMSNYTYSFKINCLKSMLPNALRVKYKRKLQIISDIHDDEILKLFHKNKEIDFIPSKFSEPLLKKILKLKRKNKIKVNYFVSNRAKIKKIKVFKTNLSLFALKKIKFNIKNAPKQRELISFLINHHERTFIQSKFFKNTNFTSNDLKNAERKGWIYKFFIIENRVPWLNQSVLSTLPKNLNSEQQAAVDKIAHYINFSLFKVALLEGVTGSGKTEVYLQIIQHALNKNKTALMLVPEITLTPQIIERFKARFGNKVAIFHSALSIGERYDEWRKIKNGEASIVVGARSAIFVPLKNIGIIIMDEEHENSYKQEDMSPRYHARDIAIWRSKFHNCPLLLGSATPSLESRARAQKGIYQLITLDERVNGRALPSVKLIDMKDSIMNSESSDISEVMIRNIHQKLLKNEQILLLLNRRGYASFLMCRQCGNVIKCPNCDISLTFHIDTQSLKCHYCDYEEPIIYYCPNCHSKKLRFFGTGTQKIEKELYKIFPNVRILRMDVDTTNKKGSHEKILKKFANHEADILLGTQMIAKGLDFPNITLVGVLNADLALNISDFRSSERTFQLLTQVSGRAGRSDKEGKVLIQTYNPDHYAIRLAKNHDYESFFRKEMQIRHQGDYPPYYYIIRIMVSHKIRSIAAKKIFQIHADIVDYLSSKSIILGPTVHPIRKINNIYYYQLIIKYKHEPKLAKYLKKIFLEEQKDEKQGLKLFIDRNPVNFI